MRLIYFILLISTATIFHPGCKKEPEKVFDSGKHRIVINVGGTEREFYIHIPSNYNKSGNYPVVIMCHGTGGDGLKFYNISGWTEVGDREGIITVFPSSGRYCIIDEGKQEVTTKWNAPGSFTFCPGVTPWDDQKFMSEIVAWLDNNLSVDKNRMHIVGFSNGGSFSSYCGLTLTHVFASAISSAGATIGDTTFSVTNKIPIILQVGNSDPKFTNMPFPMDIEALVSQYPVVQSIMSTYQTSLEVKTEATFSGNPNQFLLADYLPLNPNDSHFFRFILVKDLEHNYPNGINHPMKGAEVHWNMIKNITK
jgi:poly(3-hydroxybutyrate) depolymerase